MGTPELWRLASGLRDELHGQFRPRAHAQLGVDVRQVGLDSALADEECRRDLTIGAALRGKGGDASLRCGQVRFPSAPADRTELGARLLGPALSAALLEDDQTLLDRLAGGPLLPNPPASSAESEEGSGLPERIAGVGNAGAARSSRFSARATSPRTAATRPRQRSTVANTGPRSRRSASISQASRTASASSGRPSASSASTWSERQRAKLGSREPRHRSPARRRRSTHTRVGHARSTRR